MCSRAAFYQPAPPACSASSLQAGTHEYKPRQIFAMCVCAILGEWFAFNRVIKINKTLQTALVRIWSGKTCSLFISECSSPSSEARWGQQLLPLRAKPYKNGHNATFSHVCSFQIRVFLHLASHCEDKVILHLDLHPLCKSLLASQCCLHRQQCYISMLPEFHFSHLCPQYLKFLCSQEVLCSVSLVQCCNMLLLYSKVAAFHQG